MTEQLTTIPAENIQQKLPALLDAALPLLQKWNKKADAALDQIQSITSKEEAENAIAILAAVRDVYNACYDKRKEMTDLTDAFKDYLMEFERPFNPDVKAKNKYNEKKKAVEAWQQEEHDRVVEEQKQAAKRKELENHKVDLKSKMLENLSNMVVQAVKKVDSGSKDFFEASTIENFDERAEQYKKNAPKLKDSDYKACFNGMPNKDLMSQVDYARFVVEVQQEQTYEMWNTAFVEAVSPIINEWRARIPELKTSLMEVEELKKKDAAAAQALAETKKAEADRQTQARQEQLDFAAKEQKDKIQEDANLQKMSNAFAEQGTVQQLGDKGRTKLIMKFADAKLAPKGLTEVLYHVMISPKFQELYPVFQKRDHKTKKLLFDEKGRPIYIEAVQWWLDFFLDNCDGVITGTQIFEDSKVTVRK